MTPNIMGTWIIENVNNSLPTDIAQLSKRHESPRSLFNEVIKSSNYTASDGRTVGNDLDWEGC